MSNPAKGVRMGEEVRVASGEASREYLAVVVVTGVDAGVGAGAGVDVDAAVEGLR